MKACRLAKRKQKTVDFKVDPELSSAWIKAFGNLKIS